jgi:hypothetical protein
MMLPIMNHLMPNYFITPSFKGYLKQAFGTRKTSSRQMTGAIRINDLGYYVLPLVRGLYKDRRDRQTHILLQDYRFVSLKVTSAVRLMKACLVRFRRCWCHVSSKATRNLGFKQIY